MFQGKVVAEITTKHTNEVNPIKTRILILVDTSGSMGIKTGRRRRYSKLYRIKGFAKNMVTSLDDGDFAGLVTFGENADVLLPMTEITHESRVRVHFFYTYTVQYTPYCKYVIRSHTWFSYC